MKNGNFICVYHTDGAWGVPPCVHESLKEARACVENNFDHYREEFGLEEVVIAKVVGSVVAKTA